MLSKLYGTKCTYDLRLAAELTEGIRNTHSIEPLQGASQYPQNLNPGTICSYLIIPVYKTSCFTNTDRGRRDLLLRKMQEEIGDLNLGARWKRVRRTTIAGRLRILEGKECKKLQTHQNSS